MIFLDKKNLGYINSILIGLLILFVVLGSGKNVVELIYSIGTFAILANLFLSKQPVIFFTLSYHTIQATAKVFFAEFNQVEINTLNNYSIQANLSEALKLSCLGIIVLGLSIYYFLPKLSISKPLSFNVKKLFLVYISLIIIEIAAFQIGQTGGLFQIIYKISVIKWSILFIIIYESLKQKKGYFIIIIAYEVLISVLSYFSTFKSVLFITIISLLILKFNYFKIKTSYFLFFGLISVSMIFTWQSIKQDYRVFLSGGARSQSVVVDFDSAYQKMIDLVTEKPYDTEKVIDETVDRISYIDFFAESIVFIPNQKPHTNGNLWLESLMHILQPRLFFPNKKAIDDSQKTMEYTGLVLADAEQGTSISLGYVAESYVDFGFYLFVVPLIALGSLIGWLFRKLFQSNINTIYCWALSIPFYFQFYGLEMASEKVLGSIITYAFIVFIIVKYGKKQLAWLEK